ncbi:hypothetical protein Athai_27380 [Actinocatenispora thailandica]|uniref:Uncharacterized protein n=1 Tax=Actinocatenispora thailandica TaxID=227318 RepID=A0A7R7DP00_9ACTN|nr:hypothetical protein [Actinocatenispora thailandica]BCJ35235.1 hypothetical protein Athai_27380 [Actinocatenispora thailandica]
MTNLIRRPDRLPRAGQLVHISPAAGVYGAGAAWWHVITAEKALTEGMCYLTAGPLDPNDKEGRARVFFCRLDGLLVQDVR